MEENTGGQLWKIIPLKLFNMYAPEVFPDHIKFVEDNFTNRNLMTEKLGPAKIATHEKTYIEVNTLEKNWRTCFAFEWLYRNKPPLVKIEDLKL
jgi:hypothetical protein